MDKRKKNHYIDNQELLEALIVYRSKVEASYLKVFGLDLTQQPKDERVKYWEGKPKISNYLGECFLKIATHLSYRPNFINYMYKDDMICDGIENCVQYIDNFDPNKSKNPFAYFTQIVYFAFLRRIHKEKRQLDIKEKMIEKSGYDQLFSSDESSSYSEYNQIKSRIETASRY